ncbi:hypothetical protein [Brevundimonas sp.]|uniref:hypothetical protein n=1 Tax=Brevundimonas sp. TaxID=1871086 RepID=UPI002D5CA894|nr:hypothetical protein [Brevundimonas sp.]HYD29219.1 hypothetical protein [Brevundimonas sp.]
MTRDEALDLLHDTAGGREPGASVPLEVAVRAILFAFDRGRRAANEVRVSVAPEVTGPEFNGAAACFFSTGSDMRELFSSAVARAAAGDEKALNEVQRAAWALLAAHLPAS